MVININSKNAISIALQKQFLNIFKFDQAEMHLNKKSFEIQKITEKL